MQQLVLEKIIISGFPPVNKRCLWLRGKTFYYWTNGAWRSIDNKEYVDEKVSEITEEITNIRGEAPDNFNSLKEIADYISSHEEESTKRGEDISTNASAIKDLEEKVDSLENAGDGGNLGWTDVQ